MSSTNSSITLTHVPAHKILAVRTPVHKQDIAAACGTVFGTLNPFIETHSLRPVLSSFGIRTETDDPTTLAKAYEMGMLINDEKPVVAAFDGKVPLIGAAGKDEGLGLRVVQEGEWAVLVHKGGYGDNFSALFDEFKYVVGALEGLGRRRDDGNGRWCHERYMTDCSKVKVEDWVTEIWVPVRKM
ncbi:hypothetical protein HK104_010540 [Borealophlyctis nickersoniae]|nr:hypothetical protein HK104_010540 [Borealophlyctis nickersoniae]